MVGCLVHACAATGSVQRRWWVFGALAHSYLPTKLTSRWLSSLAWSRSCVGISGRVGSFTFPLRFTPRSSSTRPCSSCMFQKKTLDCNQKGAEHGAGIPGDRSRRVRNRSPREAGLLFILLSQPSAAQSPCACSLRLLYVPPSLCPLSPSFSISISISIVILRSVPIGILGIPPRLPRPAPLRRRCFEP